MGLIKDEIYLFAESPAAAFYIVRRENGNQREMS
jgi:hypothetical protein